jgi:hypothetical protein
MLMYLLEILFVIVLLALLVAQNVRGVERGESAIAAADEQQTAGRHHGAAVAGVAPLLPPDDAGCAAGRSDRRSDKAASALWPGGAPAAPAALGYRSVAH